MVKNVSISEIVFSAVWLVQLPFLSFLLTRLIRKGIRERLERRAARRQRVVVREIPAVQAYIADVELEPAVSVVYTTAPARERERAYL